MCWVVSLLSFLTRPCQHLAKRSCGPYLQSAHCTKFEGKLAPIENPILVLGLYLSWDQWAGAKTPPPRAETAPPFGASGLLKRKVTTAAGPHTHKSRIIARHWQRVSSHGWRDESVQLQGSYSAQRVFVGSHTLCIGEIHNFPITKMWLFMWLREQIYSSQKEKNHAVWGCFFVVQNSLLQCIKKYIIALMYFRKI